jgi:hypothetical protein
MLTKQQASIAADQFIVDAKLRNDRRTLARLEARGGVIPQDMSLDQFKELVAQGQSHLFRTWQFAVALVGLVGVLSAEVYFHAGQLVVGTIPAGMLLMRLLARRLVAKFIRETVRGKA